MLHCFMSLRDLAAAWWMTDRVRISPSSGRLLGLRPGDRFVFRGESFTVVARSVQPTATGHELVYRVESSLGDGSLVVARDALANTTFGEVQLPTRCFPIFDSDIVISRDSDIVISRDSGVVG